MALACVQPRAGFSNLHFVPSQWFASCFLARLCAGFCRHKMQEGNNYPSYISSFKIFKVASQYLYALGRTLLGSSSGSFSKLDQAMSSNSDPQAEAGGTPSKISRRAKRFREWELIKYEVERLYIKEDRTLHETIEGVEQMFEFKSRYGSLISVLSHYSPSIYPLNSPGK
jgi:hypothetical protein